MCSGHTARHLDPVRLAASGEEPEFRYAASPWAQFPRLRGRGSGPEGLGSLLRFCRAASSVHPTESQDPASRTGAGKPNPRPLQPRPRAGPAAGNKARGPEPDPVGMEAKGVVRPRETGSIN